MRPNRSLDRTAFRLAFPRRLVGGSLRGARRIPAHPHYFSESPNSGCSPLPLSSLVPLLGDAAQPGRPLLLGPRIFRSPPAGACLRNPPNINVGAAARTAGASRRKVVATAAVAAALFALRGHRATRLAARREGGTWARLRATGAAAALGGGTSTGLDPADFASRLAKTGRARRTDVDPETQALLGEFTSGVQQDWEIVFDRGFPSGCAARVQAVGFQAPAVSGTRERKQNKAGRGEAQGGKAGLEAEGRRAEVRSREWVSGCGLVSGPVFVADLPFAGHARVDRPARASPLKVRSWTMPRLLGASSDVGAMFEVPIRARDDARRPEPIQ